MPGMVLPTVVRAFLHQVTIMAVTLFMPTCQADLDDLSIETPFSGDFKLRQVDSHSWVEHLQAPVS